MGVTGVGKTSFINVAAGEDRVSEPSLEPCQKPQILYYLLDYLAHDCFYSYIGHLSARRFYLPQL